MKSLGPTLLKIALAVLLTLYVVQQVEPRDRLIQTGTDEPGVVLVGDLSGAWRGSDWVFVVHSLEANEADPAVVAAAPAVGAEIKAAELAAGWELHPGFLTIVSGIHGGWLLLGAALWGGLLVLAAYRWTILLAAAGIHTSFATALRLCFIGYFFNNVMPGVTGGDVVRGALITRGLEQDRWKAALSVIVDRMVGLVALLTLAAAVLAWGTLTGGADSPYPVALSRGVFLVLACAVLGGCAYLSKRVREFLGIERWLRKLPGGNTLGKIDGALSIYRQRPGGLVRAYLMSLPLQVFGVLSFWAVGMASGADIRLTDDFVIFPVVQTISAVPLAPAGWGVGETLYGTSFALFGSTFTLGVAVSILFRLLTQVGFGLIGGLVWVLGRQRQEEVRLIKDERS